MTWILTSSGREFDYADPQPSMVCIEDIAIGLAHESRFAGQTDPMYTVAQHSVLISRHVPAELALEALLHDAAEAYCKDIPTPLKRLLPDYKAIVQRVDAAIRTRFNLPPEETPIIKTVDRQLLAIERNTLLPLWNRPWGILEGVEPLPVTFQPATPNHAHLMFIARWLQIREAV